MTTLFQGSPLPALPDIHPVSSPTTFLDGAGAKGAQKVLVSMVHAMLAPCVNAGADALVPNLEWLLNRTRFPLGALMATYVYLDRFLTLHPKTRFREPMRPLVTCLVLGMKYTEDSVYSNATWADLLGIPLATINKCEIEFLSYLNFALFISDADFARVDALAAAAAAPDPALVADLADVHLVATSAPPPVSAPAHDPAPAAAKPPLPPADANVAPPVDPDKPPFIASSTDVVTGRKVGLFRRIVGAVKSSWSGD